MNLYDYSPVRRRFYWIFKAMKMTQSEFGKRLGKSQNLISAILNNKCEVSGDMIQLLRYKFHVNPDYLLHGKTPMFIEKMELKRRIPVIADIPAGECRYWFDAYSAGAGDDYVSIPDMDRENMFAVRVEGDSMEPTLHNGDILIIDPHKQFTRGLAVVRFHDGYNIKNVRRHGNTLTLTPVNPSYDEEVIEADAETFLYVPVRVISMKEL